MKREIVHLPLGRRDSASDQERANARLNELIEEYGDLGLFGVMPVGVYTDAMQFTAEPVLVAIVTPNEDEESD